MGTPHSPKLQHYWNFTIRLFSVISRTLVGGSYPSAEMQSMYSAASADRAKKQFYLKQFSLALVHSFIWLIDRTLCRGYNSGTEWTWERWQWRGTPYSPKLQHYWNLSIWLLSVKSRTLVGGSYPSTEMQLVYSIALVDWTRHNKITSN